MARELKDIMAFDIRKTVPGFDDCWKEATSRLLDIHLPDHVMRRCYIEEYQNVGEDTRKFDSLQSLRAFFSR